MCRCGKSPLWVPLAIQLTSSVRRFERFVADEQVDVRRYFKPFAAAMQLSLGHETADLVIDCTQAGAKCRTVLVGLAYHGTVLPLAWRTVRGKKGHVKAAQQLDVLKEVYGFFQYHREVIVLGDAEYSNEPLIAWLRAVGWHFVLRFQRGYLIRTQAGAPWRTAQQVYEAQHLKPGQVSHWQPITFTQAHQLADLTMTMPWAAGEPEPLCLISDVPARAAPHLMYERRFWIETLFGSHKSRAFQVARTHMTEPDHIDRLMLALAIATCITLGLGTQLIVTNKTYLVDRSDRRDLSLFQLGWRWLFRRLALDRLDELNIVFRWDIKLPVPGFQRAAYVGTHASHRHFEAGVRLLTMGLLLPAGTVFLGHVSTCRVMIWFIKHFPGSEHPKGACLLPVVPKIRFCPK